MPHHGHRRIIPKHVILKFQNPGVKILQTYREEIQVPQKRSRIRMALHFTTVQATGREWFLLVLREMVVS